MSISAVNSVSFSGRRDNVDAFVNLDDNAIRQVAMAKTRQNIDFDAHKKRNTAMLLSLPVAEGIATAASVKKAHRFGAFAGGTAYGALFWGGMLGTLAALGAVAKKSDKVGDFAEKHPVLSFLGSAFAAYFAGVGLAKGGAKAVDKALSSKAFKNFTKLSKAKFKQAKANKYVAQGLEKLGNARKFVGEQVGKLPSALKETIKTLATWTPLAVVMGSLFENMNFSKAVNSEFAYNYADLKNKQLNLAKRRNVELAVQNDFMRTNPNNVKDLKDAGLQ